MALLRAILAAVVLVGVTAACHDMFDGEISGFRCEQEDAFGPPACPQGLTCVAGICADIGVPFGDPCTETADCAGVATCFDPASIGEEGEARCSQLCCASSDCGDPVSEMVCWLPASTTGGVCWPAAELDRPPPGDGRTGDPCDAGEQCRSGVCDDARCEGACCGDSYCGANQTCRVLGPTLSDREAFVCGASGGPQPSGICDSDDDCVSGKCVEDNDGNKICGEPCCTSTDCTSIDVMGEIRPVACVADGALRICGRLLLATADRPVGAECDNGDDCRSGLCLEGPNGRICSDTCCSDASCGDPSAFACRPAQVEQTWALRCVPK